MFDPRLGFERGFALAEGHKEEIASYIRAEDFDQLCPGKLGIARRIDLC